MGGNWFPAVDPWETYALLSFDRPSDLTVRLSHSRLWKERSVVSRSLTLSTRKLITEQFRNNSKDYVTVRGRIGFNGLFLFRLSG